MQSVTPAFAVSDMHRTLRFYEEALGFSTAFTMPDPDGSLVHASVKQGGVEIMFGPIRPGEQRDQPPLGRGVLLYLAVEDDVDVDAAFDRARAAGAKVVQEPTDQFWGMRDWGIADPDGYLIYVGKQVREVTPDEMQQAMLAGAPAD